MYKGF